MSKMINCKMASFLRAMLVAVLLILSLPIRASEWGEEWLYCPSGYRIEYSYANLLGKGPATYPLGFEFAYLASIGDVMAISTGDILGGNWKAPHFNYTKDNFDYDLVSKFYWMHTLGLESGFMALQVGMGVNAVEYSKTGQTQFTSEGVYVTPTEMHKTAFFIIEPSVRLYIPIIEGYKIPIKVGYQFVPAAPVLNGLVIGGGIRLGDFD